MPIFDETPSEDQFLMRPPEEGGGVAKPVPIPTLGQTALGAAKTNWIVALGQRLFREEYPIQIGYNPMDEIRGTIFMQYRDNFSPSRSPEETLAIKRQIMEEIENNEMLEAAGWSGTAWQFGAGAIDPSLAFPAGTIYKTAKGGYSVGKTLVSTARAGGGQTAFVEGMLQAGEETRTAADSALSIGAGTILSGMIGTGAFAIMSRGERRRLTAGIDIQRANIDEHAGTITPAEAQRRRAEAVAGMRAGEAPGAAAAARVEAPTSAVQYVDDYMAGRGRDSPEHLQYAANNAEAIEAEFARRKAVEGQPIEPVPDEVALPGAVPGAAAVPEPVATPAVPGAAAVPGEAVPPTAAAAAPGAVPGAAVVPGAPPVALAVPEAPALGPVAAAVPTPPAAQAVSPVRAGPEPGLSPVAVRAAEPVPAQAAPEPAAPLTVKKFVDDYRTGHAFENPAAAPFLAKNADAIIVEAERRGELTDAEHAALNRTQAEAFQREYGGLGRLMDKAAAEGRAPSMVGQAAEDTTAALTQKVETAEDKLKAQLDPNKSAADYMREVVDLRNNKPQSVEERWRKPEKAPPEEVAAVRKALRDWNIEYRQAAALERLALQRDNAALRAQEAVPPGAATTGLPAAGGAAATDVRKLELLPAMGIEKIPLGIFGAPTRKVLQATSVVGRRAMSMIAEFPYLFMDNLNNIATAPHAAIDRLVRMEVNSKRALLSDELVKAYSDYRFGGRVLLPGARDQYQRLRGQAPDGVISFAEFKDRAGRAAMNEAGDPEIPQVTAVANWAHKNVFEPWGLRAESVKGLGFKRADQAPGERYYPHNWNTTLINQKPGEFIQFLTDKYKAQQAVKFEQQQRLSYASAQLQSWNVQINKLNARLQRIDVSGRDIATRLDERAMEVRRLDKRAGTLEERSSLIGEEISEAEEFIASMREGLKDPDLLTRLDEMERGLRELRKLDKPMTEAQLRALEEGELGGILTGTTRMAAEIITGRRNPPKALPADTDLAGISPNDLAMQEADALARGLEEVFTRAGVLDQMKTPRDVARALRDEMRGGVTLADLDRIAAQIEAAEGAIPPGVRVEEAAARVGEVRDQMFQVRRVIQEAQAASGRKATQQRATDIRAGEARHGERANLGRLGVLDERLTAKERRRNLILDYLDIAQRHHDDLRADIEKDIAAFEGDSTVEAQARLKAREKADALRTPEQKAKKPRLESADDAVDDAVRKIIADRDKYDLSDEELMLRATETKRRIVGTPDGRFPYEQGGGNETQIGWKPHTSTEPPRGPLANRQLNVSNAEAAPWIETDIEKTTHQYLRTMVPDVLLTERTGDVMMTDLLTSTMKDYDRLIREAEANVPLPGKKPMTEKQVAAEVARLTKESDMVTTQLAGVRDRVRGVYGWSPELRNVARVARNAKMLNNVWSMGGSMVASISDAGAIMARYGFQNVLNDGWQPYLQQILPNTKVGAELKRQMKAMAIGVETLLNAQQHSIDDIMDGAQPQSKFERTLQWGNDKFFIANLLAPFTDQIKIIAAHVVMSDMLRSAEAVAKGTASAKQLRDLHAANITQDMATRIYGEFLRKDGGIEIVDGVLLPNTSSWKDQQLAEMFAAAVNRDVDAVGSVTPGEDKPLIMSHQVMSILTQFKGYTAAAHERILLGNLQRRDANTLQGLVFTVMLGMLSYKLTSFLNGRETSDDPRVWFKEGVSRSGHAGWFEEGNAIASKLTNGSVDMYRLIGADKPTSRFASRSAADMLLGPTWGKIENARKVVGSAASALRGGEKDVPWSEGDTTAVRRLILTQNLLYTSRLWLEVERGVNRYYGIPMRADTQQ